MTNKFLPKQLKNHPDFVEYQDVITICLDEDKFYSIEEAKKIIRDLLNKEV